MSAIIKRLDKNHAPPYKQNGCFVICTIGNPDSFSGATPPPRVATSSTPCPAGRPLRVWADLDYGGFNFLAQLCEQATF
ncbi:MAG: hypothetical protein HUU38_09790 [Anaerolineales bacterium]|nr:hypothetical protein [Anaerolineales bacterium]